MKQLTSYIIEKLKINKDSKLDFTDLSPLDKILKLIDYDDKSNKYHSGVVRAINDWIRTNKIRDIEAFARQQDLDEYGITKDVQSYYKRNSYDEYIENLNSIQDHGHEIYRDKTTSLVIIADNEGIYFYNQRLVDSGFVFYNKYPFEN